MPTMAGVAPLVALMLLAGCASEVKPPVLPSAVPATWANAAKPAADPTVTAPDLRNWWKALADKRLDALVDEALAANLDVAQARSRMLQARLAAGADAARYRPALSFNFHSTEDASAVDVYAHASLDAVWELGLFGEREGSGQVAQARQDAAQGAMQGARVTVVAEVVRRWLEIQAAQRQLALLDELLGLETRSAELAGVRLRTRLGTADEEASARARREQVLAQKAAPRQAAAQSAIALAVLLGRPGPDAGWAALSTTAPILPAAALAPAVLPADLLRTRPDLQLAEAAVLRTAGEAGIARSELYPHVSLGMTLLYSYNITQDRRSSRVSDEVPRFGPVIDIPLFDWGRRRTHADAREEALQESLLAYRQTVLQAVAEGESALAALQAQHERAARLQAAGDILAQRMAAQRSLARTGLASEFDGLVTRRLHLQTQADLADARTGEALAFVALYKALGGAPLPPAEIDAAAGQGGKVTTP